MTYLITKTDYAGYSHIASTLDNTKYFQPLVYQAQGRLRYLLGERLYADFIANYTDSKYSTLLAGCSYQINGDPYLFDGIKPLLVFYCDLIFLNDPRIVSTEAGYMKKANENSSEPSAEDLKSKKVRTLNMIHSLENQLETYLNEKSDTFIYYFGLNKTKTI